MRIAELYRRKRPVFSFEFFPPKTDDGQTMLENTLEVLKDDRPEYVSVTYGAGGTTRERTVEITKWIKQDLGIEVVHGPAEAPRRAVIALDVNLAIGCGYGIAQEVLGNWKRHRWLHASQRKEAPLGGHGKGEGALVGGIVRHEDGPGGARQHGIDASDAETQEVEAARPLDEACREKCDPGPGWLRHRRTTLTGTRLR